MDCQDQSLFTITVIVIDQSLISHHRSLSAAPRIADIGYWLYESPAPYISLWVPVHVLNAAPAPAMPLFPLVKCTAASLFLLSQHANVTPTMIDSLSPFGNEERADLCRGRCE